GSITQLVLFPEGAAARVVNHHHGVGRHDDLVASHGDCAGHRGGDAVDAHDLARAVAIERVVYRPALPDVTAAGVDPDVDGLGFASAINLGQYVLRGDAFREEAASDVVVDVKVECLGRLLA